MVETGNDKDSNLSFRFPKIAEVECWTRSVDTLRLLAKQFSAHPPLDMVGRANRLISTWPEDDSLPGEGWKSLRENYKKLTNSVEDIQRHSEIEIKCV